MLKALCAAAGTAVLIAGAYQGLNLGGVVGDYPPPLAGIIGGLVPVVFGVLGAACFAFALRKDESVPHGANVDGNYG